MPADLQPVATTDDALLGGKLMLRQPAHGHRAGHDAILLAAASAARSGERIADLGAGVGQAGLALAMRAKAGGVDRLDLVMIERDPALAALAERNAKTNGIAARAVTLDLGAPAASFADHGVGPDSVDRVLMNPPFNDASRHQTSTQPLRSSAHIAAGGTLDIFVHAARRILKPSGTLTLIWRADGLGDVLQSLARGFGSVAIVPVHSRDDGDAIRILVAAVKGGRGPLVVKRGLVLQLASGKPTSQADEILQGNAAIEL